MMQMQLTRFLTNGDMDVKYSLTFHVALKPDDARTAYDRFRDLPVADLDLPALGGVGVWRDMTDEEATTYLKEEAEDEKAERAAVAALRSMHEDDE